TEGNAEPVAASRRRLPGPRWVVRRERRAMDRVSFEERLQAAAQKVVVFAREFVRQPLHDEVSFRVYPNQSFDGNPRVGDEVICPDESLPDGEYHGPWSVEKVVAYLWRAGKVPEWIDAAVESEDGRQSLVALRCCGRFTASEELLYHRLGGLAPFSVKSPVLPARWENVEVSGRFDLHWRFPKTVSRPWWRFWEGRTRHPSPQRS